MKLSKQEIKKLDAYAKQDSKKQYKIASDAIAMLTSKPWQI